MAMRFAGARWLDERRRRRLAVDQGVDEMTDETRVEDAGSLSEGQPSKPATLSIRSVVPRSGWAVLAWSLLLLSACDAVIAAAWFQQSIPEGIRIPYSVVLGVDSASAATWMASALLVVAAQLALVIGWVRGHCLTDFDGRYRAWTRVAISWLVIAGVVGTGAHRSISQLLLMQFGFETVWQRETLAWLLPLGALVASVAWVMDGELKTSRTARFLMWASAGTAIGGLALVVEPNLVDGELVDRIPHLVAFLKLALMVSAPGLLVVSMGVFLRHVVHVSPEPAPRRKSRRKKKKLAKAAVDGIETDEPGEESVDEEVAAGEEESHEEVDDDEEQDEYEAYSDEEQEEVVEEPVEEDAYAYSEYEDTSENSYQDNDSRYRIDEAESGFGGGFPDPESLKGLSKRERRRLRKQWREQQRQSDI